MRVAREMRVPVAKIQMAGNTPSEGLVAVLPAHTRQTYPKVVRATDGRAGPGSNKGLLTQAELVNDRLVAFGIV